MRCRNTVRGGWYRHVQNNYSLRPLGKFLHIEIRICVGTDKYNIYTEMCRINFWIVWCAMFSEQTLQNQDTVQKLIIRCHENTCNLCPVFDALVLSSETWSLCITTLNTLGIFPNYRVYYQLQQEAMSARHIRQQLWPEAKRRPASVCVTHTGCRRHKRIVRRRCGLYWKTLIPHTATTRARKVHQLDLYLSYYCWKRL